MLKESEWNMINNILSELYTIDDINTLSQKLMKIIRMLIPYTKGWFLMLDDDQNIINGKSYFNEFEKDAQESYINKYFDEDYIKYLYEFATETTVYRDSDLLEYEIRSNTEFYKNFLEPENVIYGCGIMTIHNNRITAFFNLFRDQKSGDFSAKDLYILNILKKHLENMVHKISVLNRDEILAEKNLNEFSKKFGLTDREQEVLVLVNNGKSNQEISDELVVSLSTVKKHIYNLFCKTGVSNRRQLILLFLDYKGNL